MSGFWHVLSESRRTRRTRKTRMGGWQDKFLFKRFRQTLNRRLGVPNLIIRAIGEIRDNLRFRQLTKLDGPVFAEKK